MVKIKEVIVVEGRYDQNALSQIVDATIITLGGFSVFHDKEKLAYLRRLAEKQGLIILTDSDGAGFVIRNYLKGAIPAEQVKQAYIPDVYGKEKRKKVGGKEGKLGVEGMRPQVLLEALRRAGATFEEKSAADAAHREAITKADFVELGLSGGADSARKRQEVLKRLDLPQHLNANGMLKAVNLFCDRKEFFQLVGELEHPKA